jgi:hypothetical protein
MYRRRRSGGAGSDAFELLRNETQGLALDFTDDFWYASTGFYGSANIKDTTTPANNYDSSPTKTASSLLTYTSPSPKLCVGPTSGLLRYGAHNLCLQSENLSSGTWTKGDTTASLTVAGASGATLYKLAETATTAEHNAFQQIAQIAGATYEVSFDVRSAERTFIYFRTDMTQGSAASFVNYGVNLTTGAITQTGGPGVVTVTSLGTNEWRVTMTYTALFSANAFFVLALSNASVSGNAGVSYAGSAGSGAYFGRCIFRRTPVDTAYLTTTTAARYALPLEWSSAGVLQGLLVEESRTNLFLRSQEFGTTWTTPDTVTANQAVAPDDTTTADLITVSTNVENHEVTQIVTAAAVSYTISVYAKPAGYNFLHFTYFDGSVDRQAFYNISTGAVGTTSAGVTTYTPVSLGNGWYRCAMTFTGVVGWDTFNIGICTADNARAAAGNGTSGGYLWGAQLEAGSFPTSYIQTFASTVTRAADNISLSTSAFPSIGSAGTIYVRGKSNAPTGTKYALFIGTDGSNFGAIRNDSGASAQGIVFTGGALVAAPSVLNWTTGNFQNVALRLETNNTNICSGGTLGTNDTSCAMPSYTTLRIGSDSAGFFGGVISQIIVLPRAMTNAELQTLTTP